MNKKNELMRQAIRLFSQKGFHRTSVQEIAEAANISKGAFYKYFETKESVLIEILKKHYENMIKQANSMNHLEGKTKKEAFIKKISNELTLWIENREIFTVLFKDFAPNENKQISNIMSELKSSMIELHQEALLDTFGSEVEPFITDIVVMFEGILKEYMVTVIRMKKDIDVNKLAELIVESIHSIVLSLPHMEPIFIEGGPSYISNSEKMVTYLLLIEEKINTLVKIDEEKEKLSNSLNLLREEMFKEEPKYFLIEALMTYLKQAKIVEEEVLLLEHFYHKSITKT